MLVHKTIPNLYEHGRSKYHGLDSTRNLTADHGEIYIDGFIMHHIMYYLTHTTESSALIVGVAVN